MAPATIGSNALLIALVSSAAAVVSLALGTYLDKNTPRPAGTAPRTTGTAPRPAAPAARPAALRYGHIAVAVAAAALTVCCITIVACFLTGDNSILYVAQYRTRDQSALRVLYLVSGLWGGRSGSLLFWAWLISLFCLVAAQKNRRELRRLDSLALAVCQAVLLAFIAVLCFSESNMPFTLTPPFLLDAAGKLTGQALAWGLNPLLEHWAMVLHPPTLFIGYAGLTMPFGYAIAALILNDDSRAWVDLSLRYALFSWLLLGAGIGLGALWAYVVLGWGGYWGWDPVENASLLAWLVSVALIHSFTVYRQRGAFKKWSIVCACLAFCSVIVGTFITRSGIVQSVHAFEGDPVSLVLFGALIAVSLAAGLLGVVWRRGSFNPPAGFEDTEEMLTKDTAYYFNNVAMVIVTLLVAYLTLAPALPRPLPFAGQSLSALSYASVARPMGILYCLVMAACPLLSWGRADTQAFLERARRPAIAAAVLFALLMVYFVTSLAPAYQAIIAAGGESAATLRDAGPRWYYYLLTVLGLAAASLLFFNSLLMLQRVVQAYQKGSERGTFAAIAQAARHQPARTGGFLAHIGIAVMLVGLIGSSMYASELSGYVTMNPHTGEAVGELELQGYSLRYAGFDIEPNSDDSVVRYTVIFDVYKNGRFIGKAAPSIDVVTATEQMRYNAAVLGNWSEDLFVVFHGLSPMGSLTMDVRINPLINLVWLGFALLMAGTAVATAGRRNVPVADALDNVDEDEGGGDGEGSGSGRGGGKGSGGKAKGEGAAGRAADGGGGGADADADDAADGVDAVDGDADADDAVTGVNTDDSDADDDDSDGDSGVDGDGDDADADG